MWMKRLFMGRMAGTKIRSGEAQSLAMAARHLRDIRRRG